VSASASINLARNSAPDGPFSATKIGVTLSDTDSVTLRSSDITFDSDANGSNDALLFGQSAFYYGRLRLDDAFGPETANLPVSFQTDYWTGSIWSRNTIDSCTTIATSAISYPSGAISVVGNRTVTVGAGTTTGTFVPALVGSTVNFSSGDAGNYFSAPGSGKTGSFQVDVDLTNYVWLRFDWNNDANYSNDTALPTARYTFGNYRGNDRTLFWQDTSVP
jgi:MSHA biogenesis protein MshQ